MATTPTTLSGLDWQAVATGEGEFLIEVSTNYYYSYGQTKPATGVRGYTGRSNRPMEPVVLKANRSLWVRPRGGAELTKAGVNFAYEVFVTGSDL